MQSEIYEYFCDDLKTQILIVEDEKEAFLAASAAGLAGKNCFVLPDFRAKFGDDLRNFNNELLEISAVLTKFYESKNSLLITPFNTILNPLPSENQLKTTILSFGDKINLNSLKDEFVRFGYNVVDIVQSEAEVSFRGEIIDIFAIGEENPVRILLDIDKIESIKYFDPTSQKSISDEIENIKICPFLANLSEKSYQKINQKIESFNSDVLVNDFSSLGFWALEDEMVDFLQIYKCVALKQIDDDRLKNIEILPEAKNFRDLQTKISKEFFEFHQDKKILVLSRNESQINDLGLRDFKNLEFKICPFFVNIIKKDFAIVSLNFSSKKRKFKKSNIIIDELKVGDLIVHQDYGIGKFSGLELVEILGAKREFVSILYQNSDKLLLPVEHLDKIDRYIAGADIPLLDRLGKASFAKIKEKVKEKLFAIAAKIIAIAAKRELIEGVVLKTDENYPKFISSAGFEYTSDQVTSINEILNDLKNGKVMDRLLSGDVGFGKTEVAMNAIYACVKSGFQALFFVPTTLLSSQHFVTLNSRFKEFGINVAKFDRFSSTKEKISIKTRLENGEVFVVVGTHGLLGLNAPKLGLIIIDEEHKFGVKQKEKLKEISANSHLLSMSATPIPRSLNMALSDVKSYSTLTTPPQDREDVRTIVKEWDEKIIKEAILREIRRGGQIFYVHNHIASIEEKRKEILQILPKLRVLVLHSKIDPKTSEEEILKFFNYEYDLMICTSIIESGIHIPRVNTIIIEDADRFGIADLHQLRGRVGRTNLQGFCYFLIKDKSNLTQNSLKRLLALENNSSLGSGAVLAYHDLEIRGGGNLLGDAQSGHIEQIGYSLYLKMLENAINSLLSKDTKGLKNIDLKLNVTAFLNPDFITSDRLRLELYRRLSKCKNQSDVYEISGEIEDRFGKIDIYTKQFLDLILIKVLARNFDFALISNYEQNIVLTKNNGEKINLKSQSKDDDDVIAEILIYLRKLKKSA